MKMETNKQQWVPCRYVKLSSRGMQENIALSTFCSRRIIISNLCNYAICAIRPLLHTGARWSLWLANICVIEKVGEHSHPMSTAVILSWPWKLEPWGINWISTWIVWHAFGLLIICLLLFNILSVEHSSLFNLLQMTGRKETKRAAGWRQTGMMRGWRTSRGFTHFLTNICSQSQDYLLAFSLSC